MFLVAAVSALAQYPTFRSTGAVEIPGVPVSLVVDPPLPNGKYRAFGMAQTTASEYNCDCKLLQPVWSMRVASSEIISRYEAIHGSVDAACTVVAFGYRWQGALNFGLVFPHNDATADVPALLSATSKEGPELTGATLFELGYTETRAFHATCDGIPNLDDKCSEARDVASLAA